jgi:hypothetical protein
MAITPERKAELWAELEEMMGNPPPDKPKVVATEAGVVRDADPVVSRADPNYAGSDEGVVRVRRNDFVTINMRGWEAQQAEKREARRQRRMMDPARMGHWGPPDDDDVA